MADALPVLDDLRAESEDLDRMVRALPADRWGTPTPAAGWTVAHQIAHLLWTDRVALLAATDPEAFAVEVDKAAARPDSFVDEGAEEYVALPPTALLDRWRAGREELWTALRRAAPGARFPWFGPSMSAAGVATGRIMETWAHGQDVADALGVVRTPTARLRHVARIGVRARDHAFRVHGLPPPAEEFRVELTAPSGGTWAYGPEDTGPATPGDPSGQVRRQRVTGSALDFCLLVTQRAHRADLDVHAEGPDADRWLDVAQAFAGPPGPGRARRGTGEGRADGAGRGPTGPVPDAGGDPATEDRRR